MAGQGERRRRPGEGTLGQPHQYASKADMVTVALRDMIVNGSFLPGEALRQRELAEHFGVSPTPIREGLRRLEFEGLVVFDAHRGSTVVDRGVGQTEENYWIRAMLEPAAAALTVRHITDEQIQELRALNGEYGSATDSAARAELNQKIHFRIYDIAKSPLLFALIRVLWRSFPSGPQVVRPHAESVDQHATIIDALAARNAEAAADAIRFHIVDARRYRDDTEDAAELESDAARAGVDRVLRTIIDGVMSREGAA